MNLKKIYDSVNEGDWYFFNRQHEPTPPMYINVISENGVVSQGCKIYKCNWYYEDGTFSHKSTSTTENLLNFCEKLDKKPNFSKISDSKKIKDSIDDYVDEDEEDDNEEIDLDSIGNLLEEGYHCGYDPQWSINATIDGESLEDYGLSFDDIDIVYQDIATCVKDGNDSYYGLEVELENGDTIYVDYEVEY